MVRSDKNPLAESQTDGNARSGSNEGEEIDRIMKEIEDLEKRMDTPEEPSQAAAPQAAAAPAAKAHPREAGDSQVAESQSAPLARLEAEPEEETHDVFESPLAPEPTAKVVPMRQTTHHESMAETDAVPARDEPLMRDGNQGAPEGGLSLKIGGCTEVNLEFTRSGLTVSLACTNDALTITTDQGAEFRIPFKRTA